MCRENSQQAGYPPTSNTGKNMTLEQIGFIANRVVDFGPPMVYPVISRVYTVEKMSLWRYTAEDRLELIPLRAPEMPRGRLEGTMYCLTDEEVNDLDKRRCVGVNYDRKRIPVYLPMQAPNGERASIPAYAYIGRKEYWVDRINYGTNVLRNDDRTFSLIDRLPDADKLLNNRFCFLPPPVRVLPSVSNAAVIQSCRTKNQKEITRLRWTNFKDRFKSFLNDE